jgi:hypothetical protein
MRRNSVALDSGILTGAGIDEYSFDYRDGLGLPDTMGEGFNYIPHDLPPLGNRYWVVRIGYWVVRIGYWVV